MFFQDIGFSCLVKTPGFVYLKTTPDCMNQYTDQTSIKNSRRLFAALLLAFLIHNAEEAFTICRYPVANPFLNIRILSCVQFLVAVSVISALAVILYLAAARPSANLRKYLFISTGLSAALLLNSIIPHLLLALLTRHYTPGIISAVILILPLSILVINRNRQLYGKWNLLMKDVILFMIPAYLFFALLTRLTLHFL